MMNLTIEVEGIEEIQRRFKKADRVFDTETKNTVDDALKVLWEQTGRGYPGKPPTSTYDRTGTLGRSLGTSETGGMTNKPQIYESRKLGPGGYEGKFGTRLYYAQYVIDPDKQAWMHQGRWWTMKDILEDSKDKIMQLFKDLAKDLAEYLEGKGL